MENRIDKTFKTLRQTSQKAFIPYIMAGYPSIDATLDTLKLLQDIKADIVELGVPFTDPVADGPVIQKASDQALRNGITLSKVLKILKRARRHIKLPVVLMSYYNPIFKMGLERFFKLAKESEMDGIIIPDLPPDEAGQLISLARSSAIATIFLLAPTSTEQRIKKVVKTSTGFIYYVSITGITGAKLSSIESIKHSIQRVRNFTDKPICVGFGIKTAAEAKKIASIADGVIVGSSIVKKMENNPDTLREYLISLKEAINNEMV